MKKILLSALIVLVLTAVCVTGMLPALSAENAAIVDAATLQIAALNAGAGTGLGATIPTEGANKPGSTLDGTYSPENAGNMEVLYANGGVAFDATNAPDGAILINSVEDWENQVCAATETITKWEATGEYDEFWEPIYDWVEYTIPVVDTRVYILTADITITTSKGAVSGPFKGIVYGNGHTITTDVPVFNAASGAKFYDLTIVSTNGIVDSAANSLAVATTNDALKALGALVSVGGGCGYYNVLNTAAVTSQQGQTFVGGIQGGSVQKAASTDATVAGGDVVFERCKNTGAITGKQMVGGFAGMIYTDDGDIIVKNCVNEGVILTDGDSAGGIAGGARNASAEGAITLENVVNTASVTSNSSTAGGIFAAMGNGITSPTDAVKRHTDILFTNVVNAGAVTGTSSGSAGGMVGAITLAGDGASGGCYGSDSWNDLDVSMINCYNGGTITARWAGGMHARGSVCEMFISHWTNAGNVREVAEGAPVSGATGGIASNLPGRNAAGLKTNIRIEYTLNTGKIEGYRSAGFYGIFGSSDHPMNIESAVFDTCVNNGDIAGYSEVGNAQRYYASGFVTFGFHYGEPLTFLNCQNDSDLSCKWAAGFYGSPREISNTMFMNCSNNGDITSDGNGTSNGGAGGFVCNNEATSASCGYAGNYANQHTFVNSVNNGKITGDRVGGFMGLANADNKAGGNNKGATNKYTVMNCENNGEIVSGGWYAGAFGAYLHGEYDVMGFTNNATVTSTYSHSGTSTTMYGHASAFVAHAVYPFGVIMGVINNAAVTAPMTANLASQSDAMGTGETMAAAESKMGAAAGSVFGYIYGWSADVAIVECLNAAPIKGQNAGGIIGAATRFTNLTIMNCANIADITSETNVANMQGAGGIAGAINLQYGASHGGCQILGCVNTGNVSAAANAAGGILGYSTANNVVSEAGVKYSSAWTIAGNVNLGNVTVTDGFAGGIAGVINTTTLPAVIVANQAKCTVSGTTRVGAVLGTMGAESADPDVTGNLFMGTLVAEEDSAKVFAGNVPAIDAAKNFATTEITGSTLATVAQVTGESDQPGALLATLNAIAAEYEATFVEYKACAEAGDFPVMDFALQILQYCDAECTGEKIVDGYDEFHHYKMCRCSEPDAATMVEHEASATWSYYTVDEEEHHYKTCAGCEAKLYDEACEYEFTFTDGTKHYKACVGCGKSDPATEAQHNTNGIGVSPEGHWVECSDCGYAADPTPVAHDTNGYDANEEGHWAACSVCKYAGAAAPTVEAHDWSNADGVCATCGYACEHDPEHEDSTAATCVAKAVCGICGGSYGEVEADAHNFSAEWTSDGNGKHYHACLNGCSAKDSEGNCDYSAKGYDETQHWNKCAECGAKEANSETNHTVTKNYDETHHWDACECGWENTATKAVHAKDTTWTQLNGYHYHACSGCSAEFDKGNCNSVVNGSCATATCGTCGGASPLNHIASPLYSTKEEGGKHYHYNACSRPGCTQSATAPVECTVNEATCKDESKCSVCGTKYADKTTDHVFADWKVKTEPTTEKKGEERRTCTICGHIEKRAIDKLTAPSDTTTNDTNTNVDTSDDGEDKGGDSTILIVVIVVVAVVVVAALAAVVVVMKRKGSVSAKSMDEDEE